MGAQRLRVEGAGDPVHDEAGGVRAAHRGLAPGGGGPLGEAGHLLVRRVPGHHLDQRQQRRRIEEVQADHAPGPAQPARHGGDRQRGGVRGQHAALADDVLQIGEEPLLDRQLLGHRLDDEDGGRQLAEVAHRGDPGARGVAVRRGHPPLVHQAVQAGEHRGRRLGGTSRQGVVQQDRMPRDQRDLRDSLAHRAGADDGDRPGGGRRVHGCVLPGVIHRLDPPLVPTEHSVKTVPRER